MLVTIDQRPFVPISLKSTGGSRVPRIYHWLTEQLVGGVVWCGLWLRGRWAVDWYVMIVIDGGDEEN